MLLFRSLHQPITRMQRSKFLWRSWGTGTSWKHSRSDSSFFTFIFLWCYWIWCCYLPNCNPAYPHTLLLPLFFIHSACYCAFLRMAHKAARRSKWVQIFSLNVFMFVFVSSGVWWRDAGEALCSTILKDWSEHCCHATDFCCHGCLGRFLERCMWEVRYSLMST